MAKVKTCYKYCIVPNCKNTTISAPNKLFICIPRDPSNRKKWFIAMKRQHHLSLKPSNAKFCCEDHFDLETDLENYMRHKMMGGRLLLREGVVPHKFECQERQKSNIDRPPAGKRGRVDPLSPSVELPVEFVNYVDVPGKKYFNENVEDKYKRKLPKKNINDTGTPCDTFTRKHVRSKGRKTISLAPNVMETKRAHHEGSPTDVSVKNEGACWDDVVEKSLYATDDSTGHQDTTTTDEKEFASAMKKATLKSIHRHPKFLLGLAQESYIKRLCEYTKRSQLDIMITLRKIRLNEPFSILAMNFGMTKCAIEEIFFDSVPLLAGWLSELIIFPPQEKIALNLPLAFRKSLFNVHSLIDCFEIEIAKPCGLSEQALTRSEYKSCNTVKFLLSITPDGLISFVSRCYAGSTSNVAIFEDSGFLDKITSGAVLAGRGFENISHLLRRQGCALIRPPTVSAESKCSKEKVAETKRIAALKVHLDRAISRLRDFRMISPHACLDTHHLKLLDDILIITCGIVNLLDA